MTDVARAPIRWNRRQFLGAAGAAAVWPAAVAGCTPGEAGRSSAGGVTITHAFGDTTVPAPPTRVVSAGLTDQDDLLSVGVVPVAVTTWFGDQPFGVWPWAQPKLGSATPAVLNLDNGIQIDQIAMLKPDLIVAVNAGLDADTYQKLSEIAPTIAQSGDDAFFEPWRQQAAAIGAAVFKKAEMATLVEAVDAKFAAVAQANPTFKDRTAVLLDGYFTGDTITATVAGWRTEFLTAMGLTVPDAVKGFASGDHAMIARGAASNARQGRRPDLVHRQRRRTGRAARRPGGGRIDRLVTTPQRLHDGGTVRGDRLRFPAVVSAGGRSAAAPAASGTGLTAVIG